MCEDIKKLKYAFENNKTKTIYKDRGVFFSSMGIEWAYPFTFTELNEAYYIAEEFLDRSSQWLKRRGLSSNIGIIPLHQNIRRFVHNCKCGEYNFVTAIHMWDDEYKLLKMYTCSNCGIEIDSIDNFVSDELTKKYIDLIKDNINKNPLRSSTQKNGWSYNVLGMYDHNIDGQHCIKRK